MVLELSAYVGYLKGGPSGAGITFPYSVSQIIDSAAIYSVPGLALLCGRGLSLIGLAYGWGGVYPALIGLSGGTRLEKMFSPRWGKKFLMQNPVLSPGLSIRLQSPGPPCFQGL